MFAIKHSNTDEAANTSNIQVDGTMNIKDMDQQIRNYKMDAINRAGGSCRSKYSKADDEGRYPFGTGQNRSTAGKGSFVDVPPRVLETPEIDSRANSRTSGINNTLPVTAEDIFLRKTLSFKSKPKNARNVTNTFGSRNSTFASKASQKLSNFIHASNFIPGSNGSKKNKTIGLIKKNFRAKIQNKKKQRSKSNHPEEVDAKIVNLDFTQQNQQKILDMMQRLESAATSFEHA